MPEFFNVLPPDEARALLLQAIEPLRGIETVVTDAALDRVLAATVRSPEALPAFRRSTMDGYAVRAADTFGAGDSLPALLSVIGEVPMGQAAAVVLGSGEAVVVHTGGMLPDAADAVVPVEHTQVVGASSALTHEIEVSRSVAVGQNVLQVGEDVRPGAVILPAGHRVRPQDIGGLLALGVTAVSVAAQPVVGIIATGDEVVPPDEPAGPGQIRDINSYTIGGQVRRAGGRADLRGIVGDSFAALREAAAAALAECDMVVMTAGSSVSVRDMTVEVIDSLGEPGVLLHGVATRPGKPTIVGVVDGKPVLGLPGNPVSAMIQFDMFGTPAIERLLGLATRPRPQVWARLTQNIASESGREDYVAARLEVSEDGYLAIPVFGKSNLIYTLIHADGLIKVPLNKGGLMAGEAVAVTLF
jgi:molybdopterin molybdotransferase